MDEMERMVVEDRARVDQNTKDIVEIKEVLKELTSSTKDLFCTMQLVVQQMKQITDEQNESKKNDTISVTSMIKTAIVSVVSGGIGCGIVYAIILNIK